MKLLGDFFMLDNLVQGTDELHAVLKTVPGHFVYRAHFPGCPITPGVFLVQVVVELAAVAWHRSLMIKTVKNVKYLSQLDPNLFPVVEVAVSRMECNRETLGETKLTAHISKGDSVFAKIELMVSTVC